MGHLDYPRKEIDPSTALYVAAFFGYVLGTGYAYTTGNLPKSLGVQEGFDHTGRVIDSIPANDQKAYGVVCRQAANIIGLGQFDLTVWNGSVFRSAVSGYESFWGEDNKPEYWPTKPQIWLFDDPDKLDDPQSGMLPIGFRPRMKDSEYGAIGVYIYPSERVITGTKTTVPSGGLIWLFIPKDRNRIDLPPRTEWFPGTPFNAKTDEQDAVIIAARQFLALPFVGIAESQGNHTQRKAYKKRNVTPPLVRTVILRKRESHSNGTGDTDGTHREFSCHFRVTGHWRKLHTPRKADGAQITYVREHVKGDTSKPFRDSRTIYAAVR